MCQIVLLPTTSFQALSPDIAGRQKTKLNNSAQETGTHPVVYLIVFSTLIPSPTLIRARCSQIGQRLWSVHSCISFRLVWAQQLKHTGQFALLLGEDFGSVPTWVLAPGAISSEQITAVRIQEPLIVPLAIGQRLESAKHHCFVAKNP